MKLKGNIRLLQEGNVLNPMSYGGLFWVESNDYEFEIANFIYVMT